MIKKGKINCDCGKSDCKRALTFSFSKYGIWIDGNYFEWKGFLKSLIEAWMSAS